MIVASRMNWAALTPSRCASRSTRVQSASAKRTVVARIGMAGTVSPMALPLSHGSNPDPHAHPVPKTLPARIDCQGWRSEMSFEAIYARHAAEVHRAANAILRDAALAEDVVQEVFERLWRGSGHDERRGPLGPVPQAARPQPRPRSLAPHPDGRAGAAAARGAGAARRPAASQLPEAVLAGASDRRLARAAVRRLPGRPASGHRPRLLGWPVGAGAGRCRGDSPRHGEEPPPAGAHKLVTRPRTGDLAVAVVQSYGYPHPWTRTSRYRNRHRPLYA